MAGMTGKQRVLVALAAAHIAIVAAHAWHVPIEPHLPHGVQRALAVYGGYTGATSHYDFFAPSVSTQGRMAFRIFAPGGKVREFELSAARGDVNNRIAILLTYYAFPSERQKLLESGARYMLRAHPEATAVEARVEIVDVPPLREASVRGTRIKWVELGRLTVSRGEGRGH
jgi:hypothetical protein